MFDVEENISKRQQTCLFLTRTHWKIIKIFLFNLFPVMHLGFTTKTNMAAAGCLESLATLKTGK